MEAERSRLPLAILPPRSRLPLAILVAVAATGAATFLLRPRSGLIDPAPVDVQAYFTHFQLDRAEDYRSLQRVLGLAGVSVSGATLALLAWRPPRRLLARFGRHPLIGGAVAGTGISLLLVVTGLPLAAWRHQRAIDFGLATQSWGEWLVDVAKAAAVGAVGAAVGGLLALALVRRFRRKWWVPAAVCVVAYGVITIWLWPVLVDPLFNDFKKLPPGQLRSDVLELARRAHVDVGEVYRVDASRRTTAANAYVNGLGHTKRVVLFDNLIDGFPRDEINVVVAHELGHQKHRDVLRGLLWLALVAPAGTYLAQCLAEAVGRRQGLADRAVEPGPVVLPAIAFSFVIVSLAFGSISNVLSREVEARADAFALNLTKDPGAFIGFERRLTVRNVADPDPPGLFQSLFGTHPTPQQRIGIGEAWKRGE